MKVSILQNQLKEALAIATRAVDNRPTLPILGNVLLRTIDARLEIVGTNLEHTVSVKIGAKVDAPGAITLPARTLTELIGNLSPERVDLTLNEGTQSVSVRCGGAKSTIKGIAATEFPPVSEPESWLLDMPAVDFVRLVRGAAICAAREDNRPILTGLYFHLDNGCLEVAAADGYRLAFAQVEIVGTGSAAFEVVIPADALKEFAKAVNEDGIVQIGFVRDSIYLANGRVTTSIQLLEGKFPDFQVIIPRHWNTRLTCSTADLLRACKRAEIFARDSNNSARLMIKPGATPNEPGEVAIIGKSAERGDMEAMLDARIEGEELTAAYNVRYLMDALGAIPTDQVVFDTKSAADPCSLSPVGDSGIHTFVIMPMSINR